MTCDALDWEGRGPRLLSADEAEHVAHCSVCQQARALWEALRATGGAGPRPDVVERIRQGARQALADAPVATRWTRIFGEAAAAALVPGVVAIAAMHRRPDWSTLPPMGIAVTIAMLALVFFLAARAAFSPGLFPRGRRMAGAAAVLGAVVVLAFPGPHGGVVGGGGLGCFLGVVGISLLPLLALLAVLRVRTRSPLAGLCAGIAAGALGEAALFVHCPACGLGHLCRAHLTGWLAVALIGTALLLLFPQRIWKPRAQRG